MLAVLVFFVVVETIASSAFAAEHLGVHLPKQQRLGRNGTGAAAAAEKVVGRKEKASHHYHYHGR